MLSLSKNPQSLTVTDNNLSKSSVLPLKRNEILSLLDFFNSREEMTKKVMEGQLYRHYSILRNPLQATNISKLKVITKAMRIWLKRNINEISDDTQNRINNNQGIKMSLSKLKIPGFTKVVNNTEVDPVKLEPEVLATTKDIFEQKKEPIIDEKIQMKKIIEVRQIIRKLSRELAQFIIPQNYPDKIKEYSSTALVNLNDKNLDELNKLSKNLTLNINMLYGNSLTLNDFNRLEQHLFLIEKIINNNSDLEFQISNCFKKANQYLLTTRRGLDKVKEQGVKNIETRYKDRIESVNKQQLTLLSTIIKTRKTQLIKLTESRILPENIKQLISEYDNQPLPEMISESNMLSLQLSTLYKKITNRYLSINQNAILAELENKILSYNNIPDNILNKVELSKQHRIRVHNDGTDDINIKFRNRQQQLTRILDSLSNLGSNKQKLTDIKMETGETVQDEQIRLLQIAHQLTKFGKEVSSETMNKLKTTYNNVLNDSTDIKNIIIQNKELRDAIEDFQEELTFDRHQTRFQGRINLIKKHLNSNESFDFYLSFFPEQKEIIQKLIESTQDFIDNLTTEIKQADNLSAKKIFNQKANEIDHNFLKLLKSLSNITCGDKTDKLIREKLKPELRSIYERLSKIYIMQERRIIVNKPDYDPRKSPLRNRLSASLQKVEENLKNKSLSIQEISQEFEQLKQSIKDREKHEAIKSSE